MGFPGGSDCKESAFHEGDPGPIPGSGRSLEKWMAIHSSILTWGFHGQRSLAVYHSWGHKESDTTEWLTLTLPYTVTNTHIHICVCVYTHIYMYACMLSCSSHVWLFVTSWTVPRQASLSMGFSRQGYWSGLPCPPPGDLPNPGIKPRSPTLQADSLSAEPQGKPEFQLKSHKLPRNQKAMKIFSFVIKKMIQPLHVNVVVKYLEFNFPSCTTQYIFWNYKHLLLEKFIFII